jgi:polyphosphate kinase 2 (PPK2 family)
MGFCSKEEHRRILELCPLIEKFVVDGGIQLMKIWLEVSDKEQKRRFEARIDDPLRQWKLSPMDLPSRERWYEYSRARDKMLEVTTRSTRRGIRARSDQPWQFHQTGHGGSKVPDLAGALLQSR